MLSFRTPPPLGRRARVSAMGHPAPCHAIRLQAGVSSLPRASYAAVPTWWASPTPVYLMRGPALAPLPCELSVLLACFPCAAFFPPSSRPHHMSPKASPQLICHDHCGSSADSFPSFPTGKLAWMKYKAHL